MQAVVAAAIPEVIAQTLAYQKDVVGRHRDISPIVQPMKVTAEQEAVVHAVFSPGTVGQDVGRFQNRKRVLTGNGAGSPIRIPDGQTEESLTETWSHLDGSPESPEVLCDRARAPQSARTG